MVARPGQYYANFNGGELAPEVHGRTDVKQYYAGAAEMTNAEPVAQGGFRLMPRSKLMGRMRRALSELTPDSTTDSSGSFSDVGTVYEVGFNATQSLSVAIVEGFYVAGLADPLEDYLQIQYLDTEATWQDLGTPFRLTGTSRNIARALPPDEPVQADGLRVRLIETPGSAITITVGGLTAKAEGAGYTEIRNIPFTFSTEQAYVLALTRGHGDVWREGVLVSSFAIDDAITDPRTITHEQRFDTLLLYHEDMVPRRVLRDGADDEWVWDPVPYENIPEVDYGDDYTDVTDEWNIYVRYPSGTTEGRETVIALTIDGEETSGVTVPTAAAVPTSNTAWDQVAADLEDVIEALAAISAGVTVSRVGNAGATATTLKLEFTGAGNEGPHTIAAQVVSHTDRSATVGHTVIGKVGGEAIMSASRGWPSCARLYQDRLTHGGFKARKSALLASVTGQYYDLNTATIADTGAILIGIDTIGAERIQRIERSKHLVIFTSDAEYYISDRAVTRNVTPTVVECSRNGSAQIVPILSSEGELLYISKNRGVALAMSFSDLSQSYESEPISLLASHLIVNVADAGFQRPEEEMDAGRYFLPRDDGVMAVGIFIRQQEISAFVRWQTDGNVKSVAVDGMNYPYIAVEREVDGATVRFFERLEIGLIFDCTKEIDLGTPGTTVSDLDDYEGAEVWATADGYVVGPFTVDGGEIELPFAATDVTVGRWTPPRVRPLPIPRGVAERVVLNRPIRVHTIRGVLINTSSLAIGANGGDVENVPLYRSGDPTDAPLAAYSGDFDVTGLVGFTETGDVEITQLRPGTLQVRDLVVEAKL